jgi:hypothetical protein
MSINVYTPMSLNEYKQFLNRQRTEWLASIRKRSRNAIGEAA